MRVSPHTHVSIHPTRMTVRSTRTALRADDNLGVRRLTTTRHTGAHRARNHPRPASHARDNAARQVFRSRNTRVCRILFGSTDARDATRVPRVRGEAPRPWAPLPLSLRDVRTGPDRSRNATVLTKPGVSRASRRNPGNAVGHTSSGEPTTTTHTGAQRARNNPRMALPA